ncbi:carboxylesterase family protein [Lachnospiraceae bacterium OttesenSCG-928-D06]|nr:carboxylesterase family protein [Lachnospiraceae bacterium OttesenSCG-928-D06]
MVETVYGKISGIACDGYTKYLGIPYAKPPLGSRRFKRPEPPEPWDGVLEATKFGFTAMQQDAIPGTFYYKEFYENPDYIYHCSEDCLTLNIYVPDKKCEEEFPVAFWIHGGAFQNGYSGKIEFDGQEYAKRGVILVTINYRCNVFGFLAHPWLTEADPDNLSGNYGMYDQLAALKWVYENIGNFNGDRENITVFGQSAGAMSVQMLVSSPLTGSMIKKAVLQSGGSYGEGLDKQRSLLEGEILGLEFTNMLGVHNIDELYALSAKDLLDGFIAFRDEKMKNGFGLTFAPIIDGCFSIESNNSAIENGRIKSIPYMIGSTANDLAAEASLNPDREKSLLYVGSIEFAKKINQIYRQPVYVYYFSRQLPGDEKGAFHSSDLWYTFGTLGRCWRPMTKRDYTLSNTMLEYWTNFIKTGDPNSGDMEEWYMFSERGEFVMELN